MKHAILLSLLLIIATFLGDIGSFQLQRFIPEHRSNVFIVEGSSSEEPSTVSNGIKRDTLWVTKIASSVWLATQTGIQAVSAAQSGPIPRAANRPLAYSVEFTDPPCLQPRTKLGQEGAIRRFTDADVVILGEHHYSQDDHELQASLIGRMLDEAKGKGKRLTIGLEMVQRGNPQYQAALDAYVSSKGQGISEEEADAAVVIGTEWEKNWQWDFEVYKPIFHLARNREVPLIALNVATETTNRVLADGLDGLNNDDRQIYIPDPLGFVESVRGEGFQRYTEKVILPSYEFYAKNNLLGKNPTPEKFFASRIFSDEAIGANAADYVATRPNNVMVVLVGMEKVKCGYGVRERTLRELNRQRGLAGENKEGTAATVLSVLMNPTALDSLSPTVQLQLVLAYGPFLKDQRPFGDFLWYSKSPPVKILTRPKNPINNEGDKPAGESSIIGAF